jgi:hypothetical protein
MSLWRSEKNVHSLIKTQMPSKTTRSLKILFAISIIIALSSTGCSSTQNSSQKNVLIPNKKISKTDKEITGTDQTLIPANKKLVLKDFTLTYIDQEEADGGIDQFTLQHPLSITEQQVVLHMVALNYEKYSKPSIASPVFTKENIKKTKRLLTKALNKAHPRNIIGFEVASDTGTTQGQLFASRGVLHWRFFKIRGVWFSKTRNSVEQYGTWRMVPRNEQRFHKSRKHRGTRQWTNWIEAEINLPAPTNLKTSRPRIKHPDSGTAQTAPSHSQPSLPKTISPKKDVVDLEEKLKFLKYLHKNQLIDKREYELKRKDLLNQYL